VIEITAEMERDMDAIKAARIIERDRCAAILRSLMPPAWGAGPRKNWEKAFREALRQIEKKEAD
jgi:hypothetical protein